MAHHEIAPGQNILQDTVNDPFMKLVHSKAACVHICGEPDDPYQVWAAEVGQGWSAAFSDKTKSQDQALSRTTFGGCFSNSGYEVEGQTPTMVKGLALASQPEHPQRIPPDSTI
ncbi:hypothetical protein PGT21_033999 [Puccinia graminis f. sp. tritici]|uniref:Uncharacterized protein n=1 Tax=Puccinia graminis f. sp. tritici TaxID=56615 RepID=A0A5B0MZX0_PUCGR|nr:hypothetical protein PGT21_033999 [Puccinia graminis f. sp. tritici]KAA1081816.1 hypothetical protein PGTUg99_013140 [Puccinia graminis f. sp. tritici]